MTLRPAWSRSARTSKWSCAPSRATPNAWPLTSCPTQAADFAAGFLGASTPLARAIMGRSPGVVVRYAAGDIVEAVILSVRLSERAADDGAAAERDAATREAVQRAKTDETIQLALTFSSKWGDYDPEPLEPGASLSDDERSGDEGPGER